MGEQKDSLFLGLSLGMTKKAFFDTCWSLNRQKIVKEGMGMNVEYILYDGFKGKVKMLFFPTFQKEKVAEMKVRYAYDAWAPWNESLSADSLLLEVRDKLEHWYTVDFIPVQSDRHGNTFVNIDGNRRILIYKADEQYVEVRMSDLDQSSSLVQ